LATFAAIKCAAPRRAGSGDTLAAREKRQGQNRLAVILYDHHQSRIILVAALFSQVSDCVLGIRKRCRYIWQIRAIMIILDPIPSVYREEISGHRTSLNTVARMALLQCVNIDMDQQLLDVARPTGDYAILRASSLLSNLAAYWFPL
jgi:hypothetical protein